MSIKLSKVTNVADFEDPEFKHILRKYVLNQEPYDSPLSPIEINRKTWEIAMAVYSFEKFNLLDCESEFLGIGAAKERTISVLSNRSKRVFATDIYLDHGTWGSWHSKNLLIDARNQMDPDYNHQRVVWQHVDGRCLPYSDNSFDGIFSCSSIEHFGDEAAIRKSIEEIFRVLKPGGIAALSTEYKISGDADWFDNVQLFDRNRLQRVWVDGLDWEAIDFLDETLDDTVYIDFDRSVKDKAYLKNANPHIKLEKKSFKWTSVHLTLRKN